jgi:hypothetical protein
MNPNSHAWSPLNFKATKMEEKHIFNSVSFYSVNDDAFFSSGMGELNDKRVFCQEGEINDISILRENTPHPPYCR